LYSNTKYYEILTKRLLVHASSAGSFIVSEVVKVELLQETFTRRLIVPAVRKGRIVRETYRRFFVIAVLDDQIIQGNRISTKILLYMQV